MALDCGDGASDAYLQLKIISIKILIIDFYKSLIEYYVDYRLKTRKKSTWGCEVCFRMLVNIY